jgi:hypothetical protein
MGERERVREKEPQTISVSAQIYEKGLAERAEFVKRQTQGRLVIRGDELPFGVTRQGRSKHYLNPELDNGAALKDWTIFIQEIFTNSGRHIHQGGIALFILEGKGYTVVDGEKVEWEEDDLVMLPIKPGGTEHQHFNAQPGKPYRWMAFIYSPFRDILAGDMKQVEESPMWKEITKAAEA